MNINTRKISRLTLLVTLAILAYCVLVIASRPVLLHTHIFTRADYRSCGGYNDEGTGITILNPFRSRAAEHKADEFLRAARSGQCLPEMDENWCSSVTKHPLPASEWRLAYARARTNHVDLFYRLRKISPAQTHTTDCVIAMVALEQDGANWKILRYGISY
jgi:hypothetical protein